MIVADSPDMKETASNEKGAKTTIEAIRKEFDKCRDAEAHNRQTALDDIKFARLGEQWPDEILKVRTAEQRPALTINKLPAFIRQVVNDSRQNKPSITVKPVDSNADPETAEVLSGLIRNIEYTSNADVAYDTAVEQAVSSGFGYWRVKLDYAYQDAFDLDICIDRVLNQFSVYGDPNSTSADSSDWDVAFITDRMPREEFKRKYKGKADVDFEGDGWSDVQGTDWLNEDGVLIAEYWKREEVDKDIVQLSDGRVFGMDDIEGMPELQAMIESGAVQVVKRRTIKAKKVTQTIITGAEIIEENEWPGCYIPIVPVYGDEISVQGKRYFRSLIHNAKDAQRMFNYWRPLAIDTPLPTPDGWTTMGDVQIGGKLFDENGDVCTVIGKSPVHIHRDCYRVTFDDGSSIVADASHIWKVEERGKRTATGTQWEYKKVTTAELTPSKHFIDVAKPLDGPDIDLPVDPYVLGLWLGDGHSNGGRITPGDDDLAEIMANVERRGYEIGAVSSQEDRAKSFMVLGLQTELKEAGVFGNKHIPSQYLRASETQRRALLQGLMDTDGSVNKKTGACDFTTTSIALADGFAELIRSLGIKAKMVAREGRASKVVNGENGLLSVLQFYFTAYEQDNVFGLARKSAVLVGRKQHIRRTKRHAILSVDAVESVPVQCVAIDAPSHLFLAGEGMVPTHNTTSTELVALAPRVPFIGPKGAFDEDPNWQTANSASHPYLEYDGPQAPMRQPLDVGPAGGALQEALNAADDMKAIIGMYDASLGARSNETSGRAIMARQREGDVATFHFIDNVTRAIRHTGRIIVDLIPKVYTGERIVRVISEDGKEKTVPVNQEYQKEMEDGGVAEQGSQMDQGDMQEMQEAIMAIHDLSVGKYDVVVKAGPSFTTRREEAAAQMTELLRAFPPAAPIIGPELAKNLDWPGADDIAEKLEKMSQPPEIPPELQQQMEQGKQMIGQLQQENQALKQDKSTEAQAKQAEMQLQIEIEKAKLQLEREKAQAQAQAKLAQVQAEGELEREKMRFQMELEREKAQLQIQIKREQLEAEMALKREQAAVDAFTSTTAALGNVTIGGEPG